MVFGAYFEDYAGSNFKLFNRQPSLRLMFCFRCHVCCYVEGDVMFCNSLDLPVHVNKPPYIIKEKELCLSNVYYTRATRIDCIALVRQHGVQY